MSGTRTYSQAEKRSYCDFINQELAEDEHVGSLLPMEVASDDLFTVISQGILLCKLINNTFEDEVKLSKLNLKPKNTYQINENHDVCISAAKRIGCSVVNIGGKDLEAGTPHLVLGILWQIIKRSLMFKIENMAQDFGDLPPEQILLRWFNAHLKAAGHNIVITNFSQDLQNAEAYAVLLSTIASDEISSQDLESAFKEENLLDRAEMVLGWAERLDCRKFVTAQDIVDGNPNLNLAFVASLFQKYPDMGPSQEVLAKELEVKLRDVEGLLSDSLREKESLEDQFNRARLDFDALSAEFGDTQLRFEDMMSEKDSLTKEKASLEELLEAGRKRKTELTDTFTDLSSKRDELKSKLEAERAAKVELEENITSLKQERSTFDEESSVKIQSLTEDFENTKNLRMELTSKLEQTSEELEQFRADSAEKEAKLREQIESEISLTANLNGQLSSTLQELEEAQNRIQEAESTKEDLFKLLTDTITELEMTKQNAQEMEDKLESEIAAEVAEREEYERQLAEKIAEFELAMQSWDGERAALLQRIKELEEEIAATKAEMILRLDEAEKEKEEALALSDAEKRRLLEAAEDEKDKALDKVRLLLTGNQKEGYLHHWESTLVGMAWKKRYFVLRDNLLSWYPKEKDMGGSKPKGVIYCEEARLYDLDVAEAKREFCFQVDNGKTRHNIAAESLEEMKAWTTEISVAKKKKLGVKVVSDDR